MEENNIDAQIIIHTICKTRASLHPTCNDVGEQIRSEELVVSLLVKHNSVHLITWTKHIYCK